MPTHLTPRFAAARLTTGTMVATTALFIAPVTGGSAQAQPHPVAPQVVQRALTSLPATSTATSPSGAAADLRAARQVTTVTVRTSAPMVGLTWSAGVAPASGTTVEVRGRRGGAWSEWVGTEVVDRTDPVAAPGTSRIGTEPVWVGRGEQVQVRYPTRDAASFSDARLELVDPGVSAADRPATQPAASASAIAAQPRIVWRSKWGADESMRTCEPDYSATTSAMVVHHTAGTNTYTASESAAIVRGIYAYHVRGQNWCDIGYNALVDKYGQIFEGRKGGLDLPVIGAHTGGFNTDTFGVSAVGTYSSVSPTSAMTTAITNLLAWRSAGFYRSATSTSVLTSRDSDSRYPAGTRVTTAFIAGHRDFWYTDCPGTTLYGRLGAWRSATAAKQGYSSSVVHQRWVALGGASGVLGPVLKGEGAVPFGRRTVFQHGRALYSLGTAARMVGGSIDRLYWARGGPTVWGHPLADERAIPGGSQTDFSRGYTAVWSSATGSQPLFGSIRSYWSGRGGSTSALLFPREAEHVLSRGGVGQTFQGGTVFWRSGFGSHGVYGQVLTEYRRRGSQDGALGYPVDEQRVTDDGVRQAFEGGEIFVPADGGDPVVTRAR